MQAKELREKSFGSVKSETTKIENEMNEAADRGELKLYVNYISDAARIYFIKNGFEVKLVLPMSDEDKKDHESGNKKWAICWEK
jgi:glutamate-1-semialdehyde aminotransferase